MSIQSEELKCEQCGGKLVHRVRPPKMLSYFVFVASFLAFLGASNFGLLSPRTHIVWTIVQIAIGVWAAVDRVRNRRPLLRCRSCDLGIRS